MGTLILLFFVNTTAHADDWYTPSGSTSDEWANSQGGEMLQKYFNTKTEEATLPSPDSAEAADEGESAMLRTPSELTRFSIGSEEKWVNPETIVAAPAIPDEYKEALKPFVMEKAFSPIPQ